VSLAKALSAPSTAGLRLHTGKVASIQTGSISVEFSGNTTATPNVRYLSTYAPQVGDYVMALHTGPPRSQGGGDWLVLGTVGATRPIFSGYASASQSLAVGQNLIAIDTVVVDTTSGFYGATHQYGISAAGVYRASGQFKIGATASSVEVSIYHNGILVKRGNQENSQAEYSGSVVSALVVCAVGDAIQLYGYVGTATATQIDYLGEDCYLDVEMVS